MKPLDICPNCPNAIEATEVADALEVGVRIIRCTTHEQAMRRIFDSALKSQVPNKTPYERNKRHHFRK